MQLSRKLSGNSNMFLTIFFVFMSVFLLTCGIAVCHLFAFVAYIAGTLLATIGTYRLILLLHYLLLCSYYITYPFYFTYIISHFDFDSPTLQLPGVLIFFYLCNNTRYASPLGSMANIVILYHKKRLHKATLTSMEAFISDKKCPRRCVLFCKILATQSISMLQSYEYHYLIDH